MNNYKHVRFHMAVLVLVAIVSFVVNKQFTRNLHCHMTYTAYNYRFLRRLRIIQGYLCIFTIFFVNVVVKNCVKIRHSLPYQPHHQSPVSQILTGFVVLQRLLGRMVFGKLWKAVCGADTNNNCKSVCTAGSEKYEWNFRRMKFSQRSAKIRFRKN